MENINKERETVKHPEENIRVDPQFINMFTFSNKYVIQKRKLTRNKQEVNIHIEKKIKRNQDL